MNDIRNFSKINAVYCESFISNPPVRETVEVSCLSKNVNVKISCIAIV
ncbi:MAG: Rid family hydrolase [Reichenbachiella sp.]|nr:Rid family hydrolase [Reichenbachiella sp.]MDW3212205.1 Rid family hydrolase [Reichenbachiella sp.]